MLVKTTVFSVSVLLLGAMAQAATTLDGASWSLVQAQPNSQAVGAARLLERELAVRAPNLALQHTSATPVDASAIVLGIVGQDPEIVVPEGLVIPIAPEGYAIWSAREQNGPARVYCLGADTRGVLYAAAHLLRSIDFEADTLSLPEIAPFASAPVVPLRGHQIGYRDTANAYDAWSLEEYDQYIRDCIAFGTNAIELIPSVKPDEKDSVHMEETMWDMTIALSELIHGYGLEVWLWLPVSGDVATPEGAATERAEWKGLFDAVPHIDGVFVPGGDPGHTEPAVLMAWMEETVPLLHGPHPKAGLWISNQGFDTHQNDDFFTYLQEKKPTWFAGAVFGPWAKISAKEIRERTPAQYPIRRYPDITHNVRCQYPVPDWDPAFAHTLGRESFNARPKAMKQIHNRFLPYTNGFITYSDGINDDVNKMLWTALGWNPEASTEDILAEYGRYFIGREHGENVAKGLQGLEDNWVGPIADNTSIAPTAAFWRAIAKAGGKDLKKNWRFQLILLRALYDDYVQKRAQAEQSREAEAIATLRAAVAHDPVAAIKEAKATLEKSGKNRELKALRNELDDFGATLFNLIGMQLDVARYKAKGAERGAILEYLDTPLNDRAWWLAELDKVQTALEADTIDNATAIARVLVLCDWEQIPAGGFYDDLGHVGKQPHLVRDTEWAQDPGGVSSAMVEFSKPAESWRLSWADQAQTLFGTPLRMRYEGLDPQKAYTIRATYAGRFKAAMRLTADGTHEVHGPVPQPDPITPMEFAIPREATADGTLELQWDLLEGRGCQVAEVWLYPTN